MHQCKINFLTILNHQFSPKITYPKSQKPLQILSIIEVLSKWCQCDHNYNSRYFTYLNPALSQIPLLHLPKTQQSFPIKSRYHHPISLKIITQNTYLEVRNLTSSWNTTLNCVKLSHNSNQKIHSKIHHKKS